MISRFCVLASRIQSELPLVDRTVARIERALARLEGPPEDEEYVVAASALYLHSFYAGIEKVLLLIARGIDGTEPSGPNWHRDLMSQMSIPLAKIRPAVISAQTVAALMDYMEFRHIVRNIYSFDLRPRRIFELAAGARAAYSLAQKDLLAFSAFLTELASDGEE